jgi:FAD/FMN-containing dehydrogenase/Fe-S oxidoreductase
MLDDKPGDISEDRLRNRFLPALRAEGYMGDFAFDPATRAVFATDNSIYELTPAAVLFPAEPDDLNRIVRACSASGIALSARGGGTGTNGQSLTDQVVVDCSRHLTRIERLDPEARIAIVQPGVVLSQLNREAAQHGLFFGPTVSTATRATLGGMAATDASGKGSRVFGRMSDHIMGMDVVLSDGSDLHVEDLDDAGLDIACGKPGLAGGIYRLLRDIVERDKEEIARVFPAMNRGLTGYNLKDLVPRDGVFSLSRLLSGSEGTLAITKRLKLRLLQQARFKSLFVITYDDLLSALADTQRLVAVNPTAIEFLDDRILALAQDDPMWTEIVSVLGTSGTRPVRGLNIVELQSDNSDGLNAAIAHLTKLAGTGGSSVVSHRHVSDPDAMTQVWSLRSKCVGLLGRMDPERQGTAFVEDAAVPPEKLVEFVDGFRRILSEEALTYGMFGHADEGCVHVRPALDMRRPGDAAKIRAVTDKIARLALAHGGILWGEHGKGVRGEYGSMFFGPQLYARLCEIKAAFDPGNIFNPGKIASPDPDQPLVKIDETPFRGTMDATISADALRGYERAVKCNGNGQCFDLAHDDAMCPSYKVSGDRRLSPKGRAAMLRTWLRGDAEPEARRALEEALRQSLDACLSCKACASQCPVKVDIPAMKAQFYESYFRTRRRPFRHHLLARMEDFGPVMRARPQLTNLFLRLAAPVIARAGLCDLPEIRTAHYARPQQGKPVVLLIDTFLGSFDGSVPDACAALLTRLGYAVTQSPPIPNGKALSVLGFNARFARIARRRFARLKALSSSALAVIEIEPAIHAMSRSEYKALGLDCRGYVSLDMFLTREIEAGRIRPVSADAGGALPVLFSHCIESSADPQASRRWQVIFRHFGLNLDLARTGCCGMSGLYGHEVDNRTASARLYEASWSAPVHEAEVALATGFSCRCQIKRLGGRRALHPVEYLAQRLV